MKKIISLLLILILISSSISADTTGVIGGDPDELYKNPTKYGTNNDYTIPGSSSQPYTGVRVIFIPLSEFFKDNLPDNVLASDFADGILQSWLPKRYTEKLLTGPPLEVKSSVYFDTPMRIFDENVYKKNSIVYFDYPYYYKQSDIDSKRDGITLENLQIDFDSGRNFVVPKGANYAEVITDKKGVLGLDVNGQFDKVLLNYFATKDTTQLKQTDHYKLLKHASVLGSETLVNFTDMQVVDYLEQPMIVVFEQLFQFRSASDGQYRVMTGVQYLAELSKYWKILPNELFKPKGLTLAKAAAKTNYNGLAFVAKKLGGNTFYPSTKDTGFLFTFKPRLSSGVNEPKPSSAALDVINQNILTKSMTYYTSMPKYATVTITLKDVNGAVLLSPQTLMLDNNDVRYGSSKVALDSTLLTGGLGDTKRVIGYDRLYLADEINPLNITKLVEGMVASNSSPSLAKYKSKALKIRGVNGTYGEVSKADYIIPTRITKLPYDSPTEVVVPKAESDNYKFYLSQVGTEQEAAMLMDEFITMDAPYMNIALDLTISAETTDTITIVDVKDDKGSVIATGSFTESGVADFTNKKLSDGSSLVTRLNSAISKTLTVVPIDNVVSKVIQAKSFSLFKGSVSYGPGNSFSFFGPDVTNNYRPVGTSALFTLSVVVPSGLGSPLTIPEDKLTELFKDIYKGSPSKALSLVSTSISDLDASGTVAVGPASASSYTSAKLTELGWESITSKDRNVGYYDYSAYLDPKTGKPPYLYEGRYGNLTWVPKWELDSFSGVVPFVRTAKNNNTLSANVVVSSQVIKEKVINGTSTGTANMNTLLSLSPTIEFVGSRALSGDKPTIASWKNNSIPSILSDFPVGLKPQTARSAEESVPFTASMTTTSNSRMFLKDFKGTWLTDYNEDAGDYTLGGIMNFGTSVDVDVKSIVKKTVDTKFNSVVTKEKIIETDTHNINFYPYYNMKYDTMSSVNNNIVMVGDTLRSFRPSTAHYITYTPGALKIDAPFVKDAKAKSLSSKYGNLPVMYKDTAYSLSTNAAHTFKIVTYAPRINALYSAAWGGNVDDGLAEHNAVVSNVMSSYSRLVFKDMYGNEIPDKFIENDYSIDLSVNRVKGNTSSAVYPISYTNALNIGSLDSGVAADLDLSNRIKNVLEKNGGKGGWYNESMDGLDVVRYETTVTVSMNKVLGILNGSLGPATYEQPEDRFSEGYPVTFELQPEVSFNSVNNLKVAFEIPSATTGVRNGFIVSNASQYDQN